MKTASLARRKLLAVRKGRQIHLVALSDMTQGLCGENVQQSAVIQDAKIPNEKICSVCFTLGTQHEVAA